MKLKLFTWLIIIATFLGSLTPLWLFIGAYRILGPSGFWEKVATLGLGVVVGGSIQVGLLVIWGIFSLCCLLEAYK
jgi:hypothetical protein